MGAEDALEAAEVVGELNHDCLVEEFALESTAVLAHTAASTLRQDAGEEMRLAAFDGAFLWAGDRGHLWEEQVEALEVDGVLIGVGVEQLGE